MPDLSFEVLGADASGSSLTPSLRFRIQINNSKIEETIQAILLNAQIQIQPAHRSYTAGEQEKLIELFGPPEVWGQTLRNRLWANVSTIVGTFQHRMVAFLNVPCSYDLNLATTRYFNALAEGEISLLFLFSGSVFYITAAGQLQVAPISWNHECVYGMPAETWRQLMERFYPNTASLTVRRDVFDRLCTFKRTRMLATWEEVMDQLLQSSEKSAEALAIEVKPEIQTSEAVA